MLPRKYRLSNYLDFEKIKKEGKALTSKHFSLLFLDRNDDKRVRVGFVVSKKISNRAVIRNKVKRRLSEAFGTVIEDINCSCDFLVLSKKSIVGLKTDELTEEIKDVLKKEDLIK